MESFLTQSAFLTRTRLHGPVLRHCCSLVIILPDQVPRVAQLTRTELMLGKEQDGEHHAERTHDDVHDAKKRISATEPMW